jgi:hypothetical protein
MVPDWKDAWKWLSVHVAIVIAVVNAAQIILPQFQGLLPPDAFTWINAGLGVAVIVARLIPQPNA